MKDFFGDGAKKVLGAVKQKAATIQQARMERRREAEEAEARRDKRSHNQRYFDNIKEGLPPIKAELLALAANLESGRGRGIDHAIQLGDDQMLKQKYMEALGMVTPEDKRRLLNVGKQSCWADVLQLLDNGYVPGDFIPDQLVVGKLPYYDSYNDETRTTSVRLEGEGHLLTVAPTRAGKGQGQIIPALIDYISMVIVLDPKGENYEKTGWVRRQFGPVCKWAPFDEDGISDCFNPLDFVHSYEDAAEFATMAIVPSNANDPFWEASAREVLAGFVHYVKTCLPKEQQTMFQVMRFTTARAAARLVPELLASDDLHLLQLGENLDGQSENLRASIFQTLRSQLQIWNSEQIARVTSFTTPKLSPNAQFQELFFRDFVLNHDGEGRVGSSVSVCPDKIIKRREGFSSTYFIIPPEKIATYAPVLRLIFGMFIREMQSMKRGTLRIPKEKACAPEYFERKALFVLDEVAQLGYMKVIEDAMSIAASADMRFWLIFLDLNQLHNLYPKAKSMISNCKMECYFAPGDLETATKISDRLGDVESVLGQKQKLVTPQELLDDTFKDEQIIFAKGVPPIRAKLRYAYEDEYILGEIENAEKYWKMEPDRLYMAGRLMGDSIVEEDGSISPWPPKKEVKSDIETAPESDETVASKPEEIASKPSDDEQSNKDTVPPPPDF